MIDRPELHSHVTFYAEDQHGKHKILYLNLSYQQIKVKSTLPLEVYNRRIIFY